MTALRHFHGWTEPSCKTNSAAEPIAGESGNALGLDGIQEYKIVTGTFQAEYGMATGSQMVAVSKGGTNNFHGDAFEVLPEFALDANDFFARGAGVPIAPFQKNQFGGGFWRPHQKRQNILFPRGMKDYGRNSWECPSTIWCPQPDATRPMQRGERFRAGAVITLADCPDLQEHWTAAAIRIHRGTVLGHYIAPFLGAAPSAQRRSPAPAAGRANGPRTHSGNGENYGQMRVEPYFSASERLVFARYTIDNAIQNVTVGDYSYFRE